jgi:S-adenosyl-L-methionine hydrolase (adenosine-forming)
MNRKTIALLTDFGLEDPYVGQMKGVLASLAPEALVVDISHQVRPFDVLQGAFFLASSWRFFPKGTIFVAVVDPGVGTQRRLVMVEMKGCAFLAPDNGLLALIVDQGPDVRGWKVGLETLSEQASQVAPENVSNVVSATFHGRDILAPLAAELALGARPADLGTPLDIGTLVRPVWAVPELTGQEIAAHVLHVDRFGNCLLNLSLGHWNIESLAGKGMIAPLLQRLNVVPTYASIPDGGVGLLPGSQGYWELAVYQGSAASVLGLVPGTQVVLGPVYRS